MPRQQSITRFLFFFLMLPLLISCAVTRPIADTAGSVVAGVIPLPVAGMVAEASCRDHAGLVDHARHESMRQEVAEFEILAEETLASRAEAVKQALALKEKMAAGAPLSGDDLERLESVMTGHLALRKRLFAVAEAHECWLGGGGGEGAGIEEATRLKGVMLSLSAGLLLYDNYLLAISLYQEDAKLRKLLNTRYPSHNLDYGELNRVALSYSSVENRGRLGKAIRFYEEEKARLGEALLRDPESGYLEGLISQSPTFSMHREGSPLFALGRKLSLFTTLGTDSLLSLSNEGVNLTSMIFGNAVGLVESRKGKLHGDGSVAAHLASILAPGDILLEKTPFRLTDKLIPGYWGHVAVWIGTEADIRQQGLAGHPEVEARLGEIAAGRTVVEALRGGVEMNTLEHFLNIDDLAVLRPAGYTPEKRAAVVLRALRQVGKSYDFNFDVETTNRIVCSELVYHTHTDIAWPTKNAMGRSTISPDNVALRALGEGPLQVIALYQEGKAVREDAPLRFARLMQ